MLGTLYVVISSSKEEDYQKVKEELLEIYNRGKVPINERYDDDGH